MVLQEVLSRFVEEAPAAVMVRATLARVLDAEKLDDLFEETALQQRRGDTLFSTTVDLLAMAVSGVRKSVHAAYQAQKEDIQVAVKSIYNKLSGVEPRVSEELVRRTSGEMAAIVEQIGGHLPSPLPGYPVRILDGNHLRATQHRLKPLRDRAAGPLPGQVLAVIDPQTKLFTDAVACEDGHASERELLLDIVDRLEPGAVYMADRHFCVAWFIFELANEECFFVIRQHGASPRVELHGRRRKVGRTETGTVYEQSATVVGDYDEFLPIRRITVELDQPTEDGDEEIHILTNLPAEVDARRIADAYRGRWTIERAFCELSLSLRAELDTLAYPDAALLGFCLGLVMYNTLSVVRAALRAEHGVEHVEENVSCYYLADEISGAMRGLEIMLPDAWWREQYLSLPAEDFAAFLRHVASRSQLGRYQKHKRGPKRPPPKRKYDQREPHISTARILDTALQQKR